MVVCMCVRGCVCVCIRERERVQEMRFAEILPHVAVHQFLCVCIGECVYTCTCTCTCSCTCVGKVCLRGMCSVSVSAPMYM